MQINKILIFREKEKYNKKIFKFKQKKTRNLAFYMENKPHFSQSYKNSLETDLMFDEFNKKDSNEDSKTGILPQESTILMIITIDLGNGNKDNIEIKANDDPEDLAYKFITKNNLDFKILGVLSDNIKKNMSNLINEKNVQKKGEFTSIKEESPT